MRPSLSLASAVLFCGVLFRVAAQQPPPQQAPPAGRGGPGGQDRGQTFPHQQRALADAAVIERGKTLYGIHCRLCHGPDLRGGDLGGVNLLRSSLMLGDQEGELLLPVVNQGRNPTGMPPMPALPLPADDVKAIAAYIHSVTARAARQGGPPPGPPIVLNIVVGDAARGQQYFAGSCASCHSAAGDLQGLATRYPDAMQLQNVWVAGSAAAGRAGRGGPPGPAAADDSPMRAKPVTVTVTTRDGQRVEGRLERIDDFIVALTQADGTRRAFRRADGVPQVQITDPLEGHKKLLPKYTDKDIHDVTAYLVTLK